MKNLNLKKEAQTQPQDEPRKKGYHSPEFVDYGKVAKLTQSTGTVFGDGPIWGMMMIA